MGVGVGVAVTVGVGVDAGVVAVVASKTDWGHSNT